MSKYQCECICFVKNVKKNSVCSSDKLEKSFFVSVFRGVAVKKNKWVIESVSGIIKRQRVGELLWVCVRPCIITEWVLRHANCIRIVVATSNHADVRTRLMLYYWQSTTCHLEQILPMILTASSRFAHMVFINRSIYSGDFLSLHSWVLWLGLRIFKLWFAILDMKMDEMFFFIISKWFGIFYNL